MLAASTGLRRARFGTPPTPTTLYAVVRVG